MRLFPAAILAVVLFAVACGSRHTEPAPGFLQRQLIELDRLPRPEGADPAKWAELKSSLRGIIQERIADGKSGSSVPNGNSSRTPLSFDGGTGTLNWGYYNVGDYDQNGEVNIADLTPLGSHLLQSVTGAPDSSLACIDGDGNGEINLADLTPLGANLGNHVANYQVYVSQGAGDYPASNTAGSTIAALDQVDFGAASGNKTQQRLQFSYAVTSPAAGDIYWVRPSDGSSEGTPSGMAGPGAPIESSIKLYQLSFDFGGGDTHDNTDWGAVDATFTGAAETLFFSLTYNGTEVLTNIPLESDQGIGVANTFRMPFSLGVPSGTPVSSASATYTLDTSPKATSAGGRRASADPLAVFALLVAQAPDGTTSGTPGPAENN